METNERRLARNKSGVLLLAEFLPRWQARANRLPFERKTYDELKDQDQPEPPSHLFPEKLGDTESTTTVTSQVKQANEHDEKQGTLPPP